MCIHVHTHTYTYTYINKSRRGCLLHQRPATQLTLIAIKGRPVTKPQENISGFIQDFVLRRHAYTTNPIHQKCWHRSVVPSHCEPISQTQNNTDQPLVKLPCLVDY